MNTNPTVKSRMKTSRLLLTATAALCALAFLTASVHANAIAYNVTDLGVITNSNDQSEGIGINSNGQVVSSYYYYDFNVFRPFEQAVKWTGTNRTQLGDLGGGFNYATGINATGQVAGSSRVPPGTNNATHAVRWTGSTPTDLGTAGGDNSWGYGINSSGQVVGTSEIDASGTRHAVRWTGTTAQDLGTIGGTMSYGYAINASGQVAGMSYAAANNYQHAVRWTGTTAETLPTIGGSQCSATSINDSGQVAGWSTTSGDATTHVVVWTGTTPTDYGTLGGSFGMAFGINNFGDVAGMSYTSANGGDGDYVPFLLSGGTMYELTTLIPANSGVTNLTLANKGTCINDARQIALYGTIGGQTHALRLDPTAAPEPASAALLLGGGALLALRRRRAVV